jgi:hypothetical protein
MLPNGHERIFKNFVKKGVLEGDRRSLTRWSLIVNVSLTFNVKYFNLRNQTSAKENFLIRRLKGLWYAKRCHSLSLLGVNRPRGVFCLNF